MQKTPEHETPSAENSGRSDQPLTRPTRPLNDDVVDEYSDQSFPASDPPAWTTESGLGDQSGPKTEDKG